MVSIASCVRLQSLSSSTACAVKVSASCMANGMKSESGLKRNSFNVLRVSSAAHSMVSPMRTHCGASGVSGCRKISVCVFCTSFIRLIISLVSGLFYSSKTYYYTPHYRQSYSQSQEFGNDSESSSNSNDASNYFGSQNGEAHNQ